MAYIYIGNNSSVLGITMIIFASQKSLDTQDYDDTKISVPGARQVLQQMN